jgi:hypothetical protein
MANSQNLKTSNVATGLNPTNKKKSLWWLWLLLVLIAIVITIICFKKCSNNGSGDVTVPPVIDTTTIVSDTAVNIVDTIIVEDNSVGSSKADNDDYQVVSTNSKTESNVSQSSGNDHLTNAKKAIRGDYGNGTDRKQALGNDYSDVQSLVNKNVRAGNLVWNSIVE